MSHDVEAPLEMTGGTEGGAERARNLKAYVRRGGSPVTATPIYHLPNTSLFLNYTPHREIAVWNGVLPP
jgi:hypothetical protein